jgi:peptide/nickel transport system permease protein
VRRYLLRRVLLLIPVVLGVATAVFFIIHLIPGDPVEIMLGEQARAADRERLRKTLGLDRPVLEQYVRFLGGLAKGDLGRSLHHRRGVAGLVLERLPATLELGAAAMAIAIAVALPLGILAAARARSWLDHGSMVSSLLGVSIPNFWLGPMLIALFSLRLNWLPPSGRGGIEHLILPALTLGASLAAILARMTRASLLEALPRDFVRTARAKGLAE